MFSKLILIMCLIIKLVSSKSFTLLIDTTYSMQEEVQLIKLNIEPIVRSIKNVPNFKNYIIVPFNDPDVGSPVITDSANTFIDSVYALTTAGGTDCPENSLAGIQKALEVSNENSDIFVYTDAYAKDYEKVDAIKNLCATKKSKVVIFLSGFCPTDVASLETYKSIAEYCSGIIFQLMPHTFRDSFRYIKEMVTTDWNDVSTIGTINNADHSTFLVERHTTELMIVVTGVYPSILIKKMTNDSVEYKHVLRSDNYVVIRFKPEDGIYDAVVRGEGCVVRLYKHNKLPFQYGFSTMLAKNMRETALRPLPDRTNYIIIMIPADIKFVIIKINLNFYDGTNTGTLEPQKIPNSPGMYYISMFVDSRKSFSITVHLISSLGSKISDSTDVIQPQIFSGNSTWFEPVIEIIELNNNLFDFGTNVSIASRITGYPKPTVWWEDDKGEILSSETILLEIPSVYISYVSVNNIVANTTIYCKSKNYKGEESQSVQLFVNRTATLEVIQTPKDETFKYGSEGRLYCEIQAYPEGKIIWYHNDTVIDFENNNDIQILSEDNCILIKNMSLDNIGDYKCEVTNTVETKSFTATVVISGVELPEVELENTEINLKPGDTVEVECKIVKGIPIPVISWSYKSDDSYEFGTIPNGVFNYEGKLKFSSVSKENQGTYKCIANNALGEDTEELTVKVQYAPIIKNSDTETVIVREGKAVQLECDVDAIPEANVRWEMINDNVVVPFEEGHRTDDHNTHSFIAFSRDSGTYHCIAENKFGSAEKTVIVDVKVPSYIQPPESSTVNLITGESTTLQCNVPYGNPAPITRWEFIGSDSKSTILSRGSTTNNLVLRNVNKINEGHYICIAENEVDFDRIKIYVKVI